MTYCEHERPRGSITELRSLYYEGGLGYHVGDKIGWIVSQVRCSECGKLSPPVKETT